MIQINDDDTPITVAGKLIYGTCENEVKTIFGSSFPDMYDDSDLKEIAQYLLVYCCLHEGEKE